MALYALRTPGSLSEHRTIWSLIITSADERPISYLRFAGDGLSGRYTARLCFRCILPFASRINEKTLESSF